MEMEIHELRKRLAALEKVSLKSIKECADLKKRMENKSAEENDPANPWEEGSRL
jgi:hypothetical protein